MEFNIKNIQTLLPMVSVTLTALIVIIIGTVADKNSKVGFWLSIIGLVVSIVFSVESLPLRGTAFYRMINIGGYGNFFAILFAISAIFTIIISKEYLNKQGVHSNEYYVLILFATLGMMLMASAADLIVIFLGLEFMSICLYILTGYIRKSIKSNEAALKYFLLGAFATGFLLYGMALIYGITSTTNIETILRDSALYSNNRLFWIGLGLMMIGFSFKIAAVPFHMWVPDVYEGAPTTVTAFMSTGVKVAGFAAFVMIYSYYFVGGDRLRDVIALLAVASMIIGNIIAISQTNIKRMLAYSSIAHAGYMLVGLAASNEIGRSGILFYLTAYTFMNLGAFGVISIIEREDDKNLSLDDYIGFSTKHPFLAALMAIFMFSLTGIPPFAGFFGKYYIFAAAVNAHLTWIVIVGVLMSAVSAYYYLKLVVFMYFKEQQVQLDINTSIINKAVLLFSAIILLGLGLYPSLLLTIINKLF
jgi:NADH-quinone oxidoreductase subunit N